MEFKIIQEKENGLFKRKEIKIKVESIINPSRKQVMDFLVSKYSVQLENIKIKFIKGNFGSRIFDIEAKIYNSKDEKELIEVKKKKEKEIEKKILEEQQAKQETKEEIKEVNDEVEEVKKEEDEEKEEVKQETDEANDEVEAAKQEEVKKEEVKQEKEETEELKK